MNFAGSEHRRVAAALLYLQATTLAGAIRLRLKRLRQPKYLLGAIVFVLYFGLMFGRQAWQFQQLATRHWSASVLDALATLSALPLFAWAVLSWLFPGGRSSLRFSEPEIAFLFPAPLTRVGLVNFSLLRAQLGIFLSAFLLSLVFGRGGGLPGNAFQHASALWLIVATLRLHALGASFTVDRFVTGGERPALRRLAVPALLLALLAALLLWLSLATPPAPSIDDPAFLPWLHQLLQSPPLGIVLAPFSWLARPLFSAGAGWWLSLLPGIAMLLLGYLWVVRANVAFEEASIDAAARRARQADNIRGGKWPWASGKRKASNEPFALAAKGPPVLAFLWSGLIGAGGGLWRPRVLLAIVFATLALVLAVAASPWARLLPVAAAVAATSAGMAVLLGAAFMQGRLRGLTEVLDIYKAAPLSGRQIALGQLLTPTALAAFAQWYAIFVAMACAQAAGKVSFWALGYGWAGAFGAALVGPLLCAVMMCIPFAWILWFPAWAAAIGSRGAGFEVAGQRLIFAFVYLFAIAVALLPALALGGLLAWVASLLGLPASATLLLVALVAAVVLLGELAAIVHLLGERIDRFDLSTELR